jgi:hypothetical protein
MLDESTLKTDRSITNVLIYKDAFIVEILFIIVLQLKFNKLLIVVYLALSEP